VWTVVGVTVELKLPNSGLAVKVQKTNRVLLAHSFLIKQVSGLPQWKVTLSPLAFVEVVVGNPRLKDPLSSSQVCS